MANRGQRPSLYPRGFRRHGHPPSEQPQRAGAGCGASQRGHARCPHRWDFPRQASGVAGAVSATGCQRDPSGRCRAPIVACIAKRSAHRHGHGSGVRPYADDSRFIGRNSKIAGHFNGLGDFGGRTFLKALAHCADSCRGCAVVFGRYMCRDVFAQFQFEQFESDGADDCHRVCGG